MGDELKNALLASTLEPCGTRGSNTAAYVAIAALVGFIAGVLVCVMI